MLAEFASTKSSAWELRPLAEVADILDGKRVPVNAKERDMRPGAVPYYGATGQVGWIDDFLFDEELVLLGEDGAPFLEPSKPKAYVIRGKSWVNNHAHILRARAVPTGWLAHFLNVVRYDGLVTGTTRLKLTQAAMRQIRVPVAPWHVMKQHVAELEKQFSRLDEAVANLKRVKANLKRYKAAVLKAAVEGRLVPTEAELARRRGCQAEAATQFLQRIRDTRSRLWKGKGKYKEPLLVDPTDLPSLPEGWVWVNLEQVAVAEKHALKAGPFGSALKKEHYSVSGYKVYGQEQVIRRDHRFGAYFIDQEKYHELESCAIKPGDLLLSLVGTAGKVLVLPDDAAPGIINPRLLKLSLNSSFISPSYAAYVLQSSWAAQFFKAQAHGGTMEILNLGIVKALAVPLPPLAEQQRIVTEIQRLLSIADEVETEVDLSLTRDRSLERSTLQHVFRGRT